MYGLASRNSAHIEKLRSEKGINQYEGLLNSSKKFERFCKQNFLDDKQAKEFNEALEENKKLETQEPKKLSDRASETLKNNKILAGFISLAAIAAIAIPISETGVGSGSFPSLAIGSNIFTTMMSWALILAAVAGVSSFLWNKGEEHLNNKEKDKSKKKVQELAEEIAKQKEQYLDNFNFLDKFPLEDILDKDQSNKLDEAIERYSKSEGLYDSDLAKRYLLNYLIQESFKDGKIDTDKFKNKVDGLELDFNLNKEVNDKLLQTVTSLDIKKFIKDVSNLKFERIASSAKDYADSLRPNEPYAASQDLSPKLEEGEDFSVDDQDKESDLSEEYTETHSGRASSSSGKGVKGR